VNEISDYVGDRWVPACGGTEMPMKTHTGRTLLYMWNTTKGEHSYYDCERDIFLTNEEASAALALACCTVRDWRPPTTPQPLITGALPQRALGRSIPMQYIEIGPVPGEECCAQVGNPDYTEASLRECEVFRRMLCRLFPVPDGMPVAYVGRVQPHDFGNYREVSIRYDETNGAAIDFAYQVELSVPAKWDAIAQYELAWYERKRAYDVAVREQRLQPDEVPSHFVAEKPPTLPANAHFSALLSAYPL
jgi:hypothetical protein